MIDVIDGWEEVEVSVKHEVEISVFDKEGKPKFLKLKAGRYIVHRLSQKQEALNEQ